MAVPSGAADHAKAGTGRSVVVDVEGAPVVGVTMVDGVVDAGLELDVVLVAGVVGLTERGEVPPHPTARRAAPSSDATIAVSGETGRELTGPADQASCRRRREVASASSTAAKPARTARSVAIPPRLAPLEMRAVHASTAQAWGAA